MSDSDLKPPPKRSLRSLRNREVRAVTLPRHLTIVARQQMASVRDEYAEELTELERIRPKTRGDCKDGIRPCPFVSCQFNLYLDVSEDTGVVKLNFPDLEPEDIPSNESCALDVADGGEITLDRIGALMNIVRERVRQVELETSPRLKSRAKHLGLSNDGWTHTYRQEDEEAVGCIGTHSVDPSDRAAEEEGPEEP